MAQPDKTNGAAGEGRQFTTAAGDGQQPEERRVAQQGPSMDSKTTAMKSSSIAVMAQSIAPSRSFCSIPFPVLRDIKFWPRLPERMARAVDEIDYGISIQVHFLIKRNFWEEDGFTVKHLERCAFRTFLQF